MTQHPSSVRTVLVTGFEPFDGMPGNPSELAAVAAARAFPAPAEFVSRGGFSSDDAVLDGSAGLSRSLQVVARILPVAFDQAPKALVESIREVRPWAVVSLGVAVGRSHLCVERVALNCADARIPDNTGRQPVDELIDPAGPAAYFTTLPMRRMLTAWEAEGLPGRISNSAGTYVCNRVMFEGLHRAEELGVMRVGFLHVPPTPGLWRDQQDPTLEQEQIDRGVVSAVQTLAAVD